MRRLLLAVIVSSLPACDGASAAPGETYPSVAGMYAITGQASADDPSVFGGRVTLTQASLTSGTLGGHGTAYGTFLADLAVTVTDESITASITPAGVLTLLLDDANGSWFFTGTLVGARFQNGTAELRLADGGTIPGIWTARRIE